MTGRSLVGLRPLHIATLAITLFMPAAAQAATCSVSSTADSGAGTLRDALANSTCDTINFAGLTLPATITLTSGELVVARSVTISGPGASQLTVMRSGEASPFRIVHVSAGTAAIGGLTIANGFVVEHYTSIKGGGGIFVDSPATLALSNSTVSGNISKEVSFGAYGGRGGGIASRGTLTISNSTISGNNACFADPCVPGGAGMGGGIFSEAGTLTLTGSRVVNNGSGIDGGGIWSRVGATLTDTIVSGNRTHNEGAGMHLSGSDVTISGSTISGNWSPGGWGAGIYYYGLKDHQLETGYTLTLVNSSVIGNTACPACTSGVVSYYAVTNITNTTFSGNVSPVVEMYSDMVSGRPGGAGETRIAHSTFAGNTGGYPTLVGFIDYPRPGQFEVRNNVFADAAGPTCTAPVGIWTAPITDGGFNLERGSSCGFAAAGSQSNIDPMLGSLDDNGGLTRTHALLEGSPAIDAGTCKDLQNNSVTTDQRGVIRPQGSACDIGAYELQPLPRPVFTGFFAPVANAPAANFVKAGQAIPIKFSLGGDFGLNVLTGSPGSQQVGCTLSPATSVITDTVSAGNSGLTYDRASQTYTYVWKTDKSWANTCRRLTIGFSDSGVGIKTAEFTFTK